MALTTNPKVWKILGAISLLLTLLFIILFYFETIFLSFVIGIILIIFTENLQQGFTAWVERRKLRLWKRRFAAWILALFWIFTIILLVGNSISALATIDFKAGTSRVLESYRTHLEPRLPAIVTDQLASGELIQGVTKWFVTLISNFFSELSTIVLNSLLIVPLLFYLYFRRGGLLARQLYALVPTKFKPSFKRAASDIGAELHDFLQAKITESTIIATICCFGFYVGGVKGWLLLGILAGLLNIVPYLGPIIGAIPPLLVALLDEPIVVIIVLITVIVAQLVDNFYLSPFMISSKVKIDALLSIILILVGAQLLGAMGMIFAIPIYLVYKIVLRQSYKELVKIYRS